MLRLLGVLCAALAVATGVAGAADDCAPDPAEVREWAFAKLSPVPVFDAPGARVPSGVTRTEFAKAYPVIAGKGRREIELCIGGHAVWSRKSNFMTTSQRLWIETGPAMQVKERPRLEFWESHYRLRVYIGGETENAQPDYREVAANPIVRPIAFPVIRVDFVTRQIGNRDVEIASILVPFAREAVEAYQAIRNPDGDGARPSAVLGLVVDISGSTEGLVAGPIRELTAALLAQPHLAKLRVVSAGFGGDGKTITHKNRAISDPGLAVWPVRPAPDAGQGKHDVAAAIDYVRRNAGGKVPLIVLSGGDVALARANLADFAGVTVGQVTPELQRALKRTASRDGLDFLAYDPKLGLQIAERIVKDMPPPEGPKTEARAYSVVNSLMESAGMLPILPDDLERRKRIAIPPAGRTDPAWFAVELFLVVRRDLLDYREE